MRKKGRKKTHRPHIERNATIEQIFTKPTPRSFPPSIWVNTQCIQHHGKRCQPAIFSKKREGKKKLRLISREKGKAKEKQIKKKKKKGRKSTCWFALSVEMFSKYPVVFHVTRLQCLFEQLASFWRRKSQQMRGKRPFVEGGIFGGRFVHILHLRIQSPADRRPHQ
jgi:hypothetical protein